jgi:hypothetical protein
MEGYYRRLFYKGFPKAFVGKFLVLIFIVTRRFLRIKYLAFAGAYAGNRYYTIIAHEDPSIHFRYNTPPAYAVIWYDEFIISNLTSIPVITNGWSKKTLPFTSNTEEVLTVEGTLDGEKWMLYDRVSVSSNKPLWYTLTNSFYQIRLSFNVNVTITATIFLQP